jgi:hypothetical protein
MTNECFILWLFNRMDFEYSGDYDAMEHARKLVALSEAAKALLNSLSKDESDRYVDELRSRLESLGDSE